MKVNADEKICREEIVKKENFNKNMFVEAGAGAGKTTLIVKRIVNQLKSDFKPGEIVVITFTKAAAEELRNRIHAAVQEAVEQEREQPGEDSAKGKMRDVFSHLDEMNISTIHSFCATLLKEHCMAAKIPFDLEVMEEKDKKAEQEKYLFRYMNEVMTQEDWNSIFRYEFKEHSAYKVKTAISSLYNNMCGMPDDVEVEIPKIPKAEAFLDNLDNLMEEAKDKILFYTSSCKPSGSFSSLGEIEKELCSNYFYDLISAYSETDPEVRYGKFLSNLKYKNPVKNNPGLRKKYAEEKLVEAGEGIYHYLQSIYEELGKYAYDTGEKKNGYEQLKDGIKREYFYQEILKCVDRAIAFYQENRDHTKCSNDDLLKFTRKLVCEGNINAGKRYRCFYVDEFQDTDRIQESFIYRLASDPSDPEHVRLRDGALFLVGDPKQSIYRFRGAQPEIYFKVKERMSDPGMANAHVYELNYNYRSNQKVVDWVNRKFEAKDNLPLISSEEIILEGAASPFTFQYQRMEAKKKEYAGPAEPKLLEGIYRYQKPDAYDEQGNEVKSDRDGDILAVISLIKMLKKEGYQITDYDRENNPYLRTIQYSDFLLLCRNKTDMKRYLEAMLEEGIPVCFDGREFLSLNKELKTFARVYRYLANPSDARNRLMAIEAVCAGNVDRDQAQNLVSELLSAVRGRSAYGKAVYLEKRMDVLLNRENDYYSFLRMYMIQAKLRQMIEKVFQNYRASELEIAEAFLEYLELDVEHELSLKENEDAVRFMNTHKAKGLEGNIVILMNRKGSDKEFSVEYMLKGTKLYPGFKEEGSMNATWCSINGLEEYIEEHRMLERQEEHRLEYVAVTRAKQAVVFMDCLNKGGPFLQRSNTDYNYNIKAEQSLEDVINAGLPSQDLEDAGEAETKVSNAKTSSLSDEPAMNLEELSAYWENTERTDFNESGEKVYQPANPSGLEKKNSRIAKTKKDEQKELGRRVSDEFSKVLPRPVGNVIGTILHRSLELMADRYRRNWNFDHLESRMAEVCTLQAVRENEKLILSVANDKDFGRVKKEYHDFIYHTVLSYYQWFALRDQEKPIRAVHTELPFSYFDTDWMGSGTEDKRSVWMNGTADLILEYADGSVEVIDYKSDNDWLLTEEVMEANLKDKYSPQLEVYKKIAARMFGCDEDKVSVGIVSFSQKDEAGRVFEDETVRVRYTRLG